MAPLALPGNSDGLRTTPLPQLYVDENNTGVFVQLPGEGWDAERMGCEARALAAEGRNIIILSQGEPDFDTPQNIKDAAIKAIPNPAADAAPAGGEEDFVVLEHVGSPREFDFEPRDHIELGRMLGAIDLERGAKVSGSRFYFLTGIGVGYKCSQSWHTVLKWEHISNANLGEHNSGVDVVTLGMGYTF